MPLNHGERVIKFGSVGAKHSSVVETIGLIRVQTSAPQLVYTTLVRIKHIKLYETTGLFSRYPNEPALCPMSYNKL